MDNKGQLLLLTAFLMAIGLVVLITLTNNVLYSLNLPALVKVQERSKIEDSVMVFEDQVNWLLEYFLKNNLDDANATRILREQMVRLSDLLENLYASHGVALDVEVDVNQTRAEKVLISDVSVTKSSTVNMSTHTFPKGSLVIAVDNNQWFLNDSDTTNDLLALRTFGLVYRTLNDRNENTTPLDDVAIPVYRVIEDPRGSSRDAYADPYGIPYSVTLTVRQIVDGKNKTEVTGSVESRSFAGGPFIIDANDISSAERTWIINEAKNLSLDIYELDTSFTYDFSVLMYKAPRIAIYPEEGQAGIIEKYFELSGLTDKEYILLNTTEIEQGALKDVDVLFTPHADIDEAFDPNANVTDTAAYKILKWVSAGGVYHVECKGVESVDDVIEKVDMNLHPWYGFIGVEPDPNKLGKDNEGKILDTVFTSNATLFISQTYAPDGTVPPRGGSVPSFLFRIDSNPDAVPLINASDGTREAIVLAYAPFDNGHVIYLGGHDQTESGGTPTPQRAMLVFDTFMLAKAVKVIPAYKAHIRILLNYSDGSTTFFKEINMTYQKTLEEISEEAVTELSNSNLSVDFVYPKDGYILNGTVEVRVAANGSSTYFEIDNTGWVAMNKIGTDLWNLTINTTDYADGTHLFAAKTVDGGAFAYKSIKVTFINGAGSQPGVGAEWEGTLKVNAKKNSIGIKLEVWTRDEENKGKKEPLSNASVNISVRKKDTDEVIYSGITGLTDSNGKFEGEIKKETNDAYWYLKKGTGSSPIYLGTWKFVDGEEYVVVAEVRKDGKLQYFEKEFKY